MAMPMMCTQIGNMATISKNRQSMPAVILDDAKIRADLETDGFAILKHVLGNDQCMKLIESYDDAALFRSRIDMKRHGFGLGEYQYFAAPVPDFIAGLRRKFYPSLAKIANDWNVVLGQTDRYPEFHDQFISDCHRAGQTRPTPLLLKYGVGDYNCLHQDVYGPLVFPLQIAILLSSPGSDFTGGEFVMTEQRPRRQSRAEIVPLQRGDSVIFPVRHRPVTGVRGYYRANHRHGVSRLRSGNRFTLGIIFHDAQ